MPDAPPPGPSPELTYLPGIQALVRLPMLPPTRDAATWLNTARFVSGSRGSPLGTLEQLLWKARKRSSPSSRRNSPNGGRWRRRPR